MVGRPSIRRLLTVPDRSSCVWWGDGQTKVRGNTGAALSVDAPEAHATIDPYEASVAVWIPHLFKLNDCAIVGRAEFGAHDSIPAPAQLYPNGSVDFQTGIE